MTWLPHKDIVKNGLLYLRRHYLSPRTWGWRLFLHLINKADDDRDPHDHPWGFWTLIIRGGYIEHVYKGGKLVSVRKLTAGNLVYRDPEHTHQVAELLGPTWTLVLAGPASRVWGFWLKDDTFVPWYEYLRRADGSVPEQLPEDRVVRL